MKRFLLRYLTAAAILIALTQTSARAQTPVITPPLNPAARTAGAPGNFPLTLTGTNFCADPFSTFFVPGSTINFNGVPRTDSSASTTSATATIQATEIPASVAAPTNFPVTLTTSACANLTSNIVNFVINPPLVLLPATLPGGSVGSPYVRTLTLSGGTAPIGITDETGILPPFSSTATTIVFNFTPSSATTYNFNIFAGDAGGGGIVPNYTFVVKQPSSVNATAGTPQSATVATAFGTPFRVTVFDALGSPVEGAQVTFTGPGSGASGTFSGSNIVFTNAAGQATAPVFVANNAAGSYAVVASTPGTSSTATFNLTNLPGPANNIIPSIGTPQSTGVTTNFPAGLVATVRDAFGNGTPGVSVTFAAPGGGASGSFTGSPTVLTNLAGIAAAPIFTANTVAGGPYNISATAVGVATPANFSLTNTAGAPAAIAPAAGTPQSAPITTAFPVALQARVTDSFGNVVAGAPVTFIAPVGGAAAIPTGTFGGSNVVNTNALGLATAPTFTANNLIGSYIVTANVTGVATPANFNLTNGVGAPASITVTSGSGQSATVNTAFAAVLKATVTDISANPLPGISVTFAPPGSGPGGSFTGSATVLTDGSGVASSPTFNANTVAGAYTVSASVATVRTPANFGLTNNPGAAASVVPVFGGAQSAQVNSQFETPLRALVKDQFGNPVGSALVTFGGPASGAGVTYGGPVTVSSDPTGNAQSPTITANTKSGTYNATASAAGVATAALFSLTNTPGFPTALLATAGTPQTAGVNSLFLTSLQATVTDSFGNGVSGVSVTFIRPPPGNLPTPNGAFASTPTVNTNAAGIATAPAFTANQILGSYIVTASSFVGESTLTANFNLTNSPGAPASITATGGAQQSAQTGFPFGSPLLATVKDVFGNNVPNATVTFTLPGSGASAVFRSQPSVLSVTVQTDAGGVATSGLVGANNTAGSYNVTASVTGVSSPALFQLNNTPGPSIITSQLPVGMVGVGYNAGISGTGGAQPYSFSIPTGSLPPGLAMSSGGGISGVPIAPGVTNFVVQLTDGNGTTASRGLSLTVVGALTITTGSLPDAHLGQGYGVTFQATGGQPIYTWSIIGGSSSPLQSDKDKSAASADASSALPPGLTFDPGSGTLSGTPTTLGSFSFAVQVSDTAQHTASKAFSLTTAPPTTPPGTPGSPGIKVSGAGLDFQGPMGGNPPPPQYVSVVASNLQPLSATIQIDGGDDGTPIPPWLSARFVSAITPARLAIFTNQTGLPAGTYKGRVLVKYSGVQTLQVRVSFTVDQSPPQLNVSPAFLRFAAVSGVTNNVEQALLVSNAGTGGAIDFTAAVVSNSPWLSVTPVAGKTAVGSGTPLRVLVNAQGLKIGSYLGKIHLDSPAGGSVDVPISLFVSPNGPIISVNPLGVRFDSIEGSGLASTREITLGNTGTGTVNWTVEAQASQPWMSFSPASGQATPNAPGKVLVTANPGQLKAGASYALLKISDPQALNSPQYAVVVLNVRAPDTSPDADLSPGGLFFTGISGGASPAAQNLQVSVSSDKGATFQSAASSDDGTAWLSIDKQGGTASTQAPGQIAVTVTPAGLKPGVYTGDVSVSFSDTTIRTANITFVVLPAGSTLPSSVNDKDRSAGCAPTKLAVTSTSLVNAFSSPAGWPTPLTVRLTDDCGAAAANAQVVATFSNGDPPLALSMTNPTGAVYSGTWAPGKAAAQMTVTVSALQQGLATVAARLTGAIGVNTAPTLNSNGTVSNLNPTAGAALAPGTVAQIYGGSLSASTAQPGVIPLPTAFNGATVLVGAYLAPLYYLSDGQLNVQIPTELQPDRQYPILVSTGAAFTLPDTLTVTAVSPGLLNFAQHRDFSLITADSPAAPGESIILYLVGMGATSPSIASGAGSPASPLAAAAVQPAVTIGGRPATVDFAGLTPGLVGLYQINAQVPADAATGDASVTVTQSDAASNTVTIPVR